MVVPIYKVEKYLQKCLDSIVEQTYSDLEIILVDDGSPDNCGIICEEYAAKDPRIVVIHKENGGLAAAKNDGMKVATGEWITFIDADDWVETNLFEKVMSAIGDGSPDIAIEGGYYYAYPQKNVKECNVPEAFLYTEKKDIYSIMTRIRTFGLPWDKFYRMDFLSDHGLINDVTCRAFEDYLFNFQALNTAESVLGVSYCGYYYRQAESGNAFSRGFNSNKPKFNYDFICKLNAYVKEHGLEFEMTDTTRAVALQAIAVALSCYYMHPSYDKDRHTLEKEIEEMKEWPYFHEAIWCRDNKVINKKQKALQYALRAHGVLLLKLLCSGNERLRKLRMK